MDSLKNCLLQFLDLLVLMYYNVFQWKIKNVNINNNFSGSCNDINNPYAKMCVPDIVKTMNFWVFNMASRVNETCHISSY